MRAWMEDYLKGLNVEQDRIKMILDQEIPRFEVTFEWLKTIATKDMKILDVAPPKGHETKLSKYLQHIGYNITQMPDIDFRFMFPFADNSFDVVTAFEIIEHMNCLSDEGEWDNLMKETRHFIDELIRVCKRGGKIFITTPNINSFHHILKTFNHEYPMYWGHWREYDKKTLDYILRVQGMKILRCETVIDTEIPKGIKEYMIANGYSTENRDKQINIIGEKQ